MRFLNETNIDFVGKSRIALVFSLLMIGAGIVSLVMHGGPRYSIDFTGGSLAQVQFVDAIPVEDVRTELAALGFAQAEIQQFGGPNEMLIRIQETENDSLLANVVAGLGNSFPGMELRRQEKVGPKIGGELRSAATQSIILALSLILIYITFRFELRFAVAAIIALIHDVMITLGVFSIANHEVSLAVIAAFLTIVGYSLNDTIVVFDRIRENLRGTAVRGKNYDATLNKSVNQSLSRTIITSGTTLVVVTVLLFSGGEVLRDFAFALTVGVLVGTYSSIFVAMPILAVWEKRMPRKGKKKGTKGGNRSKAAVA